MPTSGLGFYILGYDITGAASKRKEAFVRERTLLRAVIDNLPDFNLCQGPRPSFSADQSGWSGNAA